MTHKLIIESTGDYPAAKCSCREWSYLTSRQWGDSTEDNEKRLREMHQQHVEKENKKP